MLVTEPPSDAAPSPKKHAATDERRLGVRFSAYATPAACGIWVASGEEIV